LGVRVKLNVSIGDKEFTIIALLNSGFETDTPQLLIPYRLLREHGIDLSLLGEYVVKEYVTAGGSVSLSIYPRKCKVKVVEEDRESNEVYADLVVSFIDTEPLVSDALIEELGIIILNPRKGYWRFNDDPIDKIRFSKMT